MASFKNKSIKFGQQIDVAIIDFAKAFAKVSHWRLHQQLDQTLSEQQNPARHLYRRGF
jgi:hypothetical protein